MGSVSLSNSNRLRELAEINGVKAYLIDSAKKIDERLSESTRVSVTASAAEILVKEVSSHLKISTHVSVENLDREETINFFLPKELRLVKINDNKMKSKKASSKEIDE